MQSREKQKELIYDLMDGVFDLTRFSPPESKMVANEFEEGLPCAEAYKEVYASNRRICRRLGVDEDPDVENIINQMREICRIMAMKMFDYGEYFAAQRQKDKKEQ